MLLRKSFPDITFSSVFRTAPQYREDQAPFLNTVAKVLSNVPPEEVAEVLQGIEQTLQKAPPFRFGPRTIDLDLLLYEELIKESHELTLPHPRMHERRFVLEPLCELIDDESLHPVLRESWGALLKKTLHQPCDRIVISL